MAFCGNCGAQIEEGKKFCPVCGTPVDEETASAAQQETANQQNTYQDPYQNAYQQNTYQEPAAAAPLAEGEFDPADVEQNKVVAALANAPFLFWLPLVAAKDSKFGKYNANHGLIYLIVYVILGVVFSGILPWIFSLLGSISSGFAIAFSILSVLLTIVTSILYILLSVIVIISFVFAITATNGKMKPIPVVGKLLDKFKLIK